MALVTDTQESGRNSPTSAPPCALCAPLSGAVLARARPRAALPDRIRARADRGRDAGGADPGGIRRQRAWHPRGGGDPRGDPRERAATARACHAQMYTMGTILRHGSEAQKRAYLPEIAAGELRLQAFGVTEPTTGYGHDAICTTRAERDGDAATSSTARKSGPSRAQHSDLMLLLARTTPPDEVEEAHRRPLGVPRRHARRRSARGSRSGRSGR